MSIVDATRETMWRYSSPNPGPDDRPGEGRSWSPDYAAPHVQYRSIIEGRCPLCDGTLERQERCGWCWTCSAGWVYRSTGDLFGAPQRKAQR